MKVLNYCALLCAVLLSCGFFIHVSLSEAAEIAKVASSVDDDDDDETPPPSKSPQASKQPPAGSGSAGSNVKPEGNVEESGKKKKKSTRKKLKEGLREAWRGTVSETLDTVFAPRSQQPQASPAPAPAPLPQREEFNSGRRGKPDRW